MAPVPLGLEVAAVTVIDTRHVFDALDVHQAKGLEVINFLGVVGEQTQGAIASKKFQQSCSITEIPAVIGQAQGCLLYTSDAADE